MVNFNVFYLKISSHYGQSDPLQRELIEVATRGGTGLHLTQIACRLLVRLLTMLAK